MGNTNRYAPEVRERAVRLVFEHHDEYDSEWAAITSIAGKSRCFYRTTIRLVGPVSVTRGAPTSLARVRRLLG